MQPAEPATQCVTRRSLVTRYGAIPLIFFCLESVLTTRSEVPPAAKSCYNARKLQELCPFAP